MQTTAREQLNGFSRNMIPGGGGGKGTKICQLNIWKRRKHILQKKKNYKKREKCLKYFRESQNLVPQF
jgi:hypothetical protein